MKIAKKLQVGVGLAIGFGLATLAAPAAYAHPPCTPAGCYANTCADFENLSSDEIIALARIGCYKKVTRNDGPGASGSYPACVDCDGDCGNEYFQLSYQNKTKSLICGLGGATSSTFCQSKDAVKLSETCPH